MLLLTNATLGSDGFAAFDTRLFVMNALVLVVVALGVIAATRGRLGYDAVAGTVGEAVPAPATRTSWRG